MTLFEVAMVYVPSEEERKDGKTEELILEPTPFLASDSQKAAMKAMKEVSGDVDLDRVQVLVRPFA